jgi:hypothetical protein
MVVIQPIRNQYLTALKERQHIIDKLNEIIRGLNALDFDDLTTIHTELVSIREALQTQNSAITDINDSIGQIESELTSFDNRLIGLNADITDTEAHLTEFENDTILNLQAKVNKNGDTMTGNLRLPEITDLAENSLNAINSAWINTTSLLLRTFGDQEVHGVKSTHNRWDWISGIDYANPPSYSVRNLNIFYGVNGNNKYFPVYSFNYITASGGNTIEFVVKSVSSDGLNENTCRLSLVNYRNGECALRLVRSNGQSVDIVPRG